MKKALVVVVALLFASVAKAENLIVSTLLDHVGLITQFKSGETKLALVDSVVRIGNTKGKSILDLQLGFNGETKPEAGEVSGANLLAGGFLKISSLIGSKVNFPEHWSFLRSLEYGPAVSYDFREEKTFFSFQAGLAFSLSPKQ